MPRLRFALYVAPCLFFANAAYAQLSGTLLDYRNAYGDELLYLHPMINYAYDLEWQYDWERRELAESGLRTSTGSVAAEDLLTDIDININHDLNENWRFQGRFSRLGLRQRSGDRERLLLGLERAVFDSSAIYVLVNPEYKKESIDLAAGYTFYADNRQQYVRVGVFLEDFTYDNKNRDGATSAQDQYAAQWQLRLALGEHWFLYSEGEVGNGFDRVFEEPSKSPLLARYRGRENTAEIRLSRLDDDGDGWSFWIQWYDFLEAKGFRQPDANYEFTNRQYSLSAEHVRILHDRHRLRFLAHFVEQSAESVGAFAHTYDRTELLGAAFYEYLWSANSLSLGYGFGLPEIDFVPRFPTWEDDVESYTDKLMASWRYRFSGDAQIRVSLSHEVSKSGFGGGSIQYQMFF